MNMFERYMANIYEKDKKPILMLRVRDYDLDEDINNVLKDVMSLYDDQYNVLRKTLLKLYKNVIAAKTDPLDKTERLYLNNQEYDVIIANDNGFIDLCKDIVTNVTTTDKVLLDNEFVIKIDMIIERITKGKSKIKRCCR